MDKKTELLLVAVIVLVFGLLLDSVTTVVGLSVGMREQNMFYHLLGGYNFFGLKFALNIILIIVFGKAYRHYGKWYMLFGLFLLGGFQVFSGARNLYLLLFVR